MFSSIWKWVNTINNLFIITTQYRTLVQANLMSTKEKVYVMSEKTQMKISLSTLKFSFTFLHDFDFSLHWNLNLYANKTFSFHYMCFIWIFYGPLKTTLVKLWQTKNQHQLLEFLELDLIRGITQDGSGINQAGSEDFQGISNVVEEKQDV